MKIHELKTRSEYFQAVWDGRKTFEVRKNDRGFKVGDAVKLVEYAPERGYTGSAMIKTITYILDDPEFVKDGYVVLGLGDYVPRDEL